MSSSAQEPRHTNTTSEPTTPTENIQSRTYSAVSRLFCNKTHRVTSLPIVMVCPSIRNSSCLHTAIFCAMTDKSLSVFQYFHHIRKQALSAQASAFMLIWVFLTLFNHLQIGQRQIEWAYRVFPNVETWRIVTIMKYKIRHVFIATHYYKGLSTITCYDFTGNCMISPFYSEHSSTYYNLLFPSNWLKNENGKSSRLH